MSFLVLLGALLLAHYHPLPQSFALERWHARLCHALERSLNDGMARHGVIAWILAALLPALLLGAGYIALRYSAAPLAVLLGLALLYLLLDVRGFAGPAEEISVALRDNNIQHARERLAAWGHRQTDVLGAPELSRLTIENTLMRAHYGLFAPIFWFVLLGPAGALLYRMSHSLTRSWGNEDVAFNRVVHRIFDWLDWLPARFSAISFAVVGDFEDALYCWRTQAPAWKTEAEGIILASGAGALGVRLGEPLPGGGVLEYRPELGLGDAADADYLMSAIGLVWRALVLMLALLLLMTFAKWLGN